MTYFILWVLVVLGTVWISGQQRGTGEMSGLRDEGWRASSARPYRAAGCVHTEADCEVCRESPRCGMADQCI